MLERILYLIAARRLETLAISALGLLTLLVLGAAGAVATGEVADFGTGVWWTIGLITTVGFIGGPPGSLGGKVLSAALMIFGFGLLALTTAAIASMLVREAEVPESRREEAFEVVALSELRALSERIATLESRLREGGDAPPGDIPDAG